MTNTPEQPDKRSGAQAVQIRDQLWAELRTAMPDLDRLSCMLLDLARNAQCTGLTHVRLHLSTADAALLSQLLAMAEGELHLREEGLIV